MEGARSTPALGWVPPEADSETGVKYKFFIWEVVSGNSLGSREARQNRKAASVDCVINRGFF